jgi:hypothetical protein
MRSTSSFLGPFRWLMLGLLLCAGISAAQTTTFTGTVYSPKGVPVGTGAANTGGDPIPNILVFAVDPNFPPPVFSQGQVLPTGTQSGCSAQPSLVPSAVLGSALSDYKGNFTFSTSGNVPNPITIVIQAGKWRRQYQFDSTVVTQGATNTLPPLSMPSAQGAGTDLPHIAISTGDVDALECIFHQIGIADTEVTGPAGTGSINLYTGSANPGEIAPTANPTPSETTLLSDPNALAKYDVVMFGCQGTPTQPQITTTDVANLTNFSSNGGRIFATHYEYFLLQQSPFSQTSSFQGGSAANGTFTAATINVDPSFPEGVTLANWIDYIGADNGGQYGQILLGSVAQNVLGTSSTLTQVWANLNTNGRVMQFTFDTPIGSAGAPTVALAYTNVTSNFYQGDASDTVMVNVTNNSTADADSSLTLTVTLPQGVAANSIQGGPGTGWGCNISTLICTRQASGAPLTAGSSDPVTVNFSIATTAPVGQQSIVGILNGGGLSGSSQCGRVLFNDYHVEGASVAKNTVYPTQCSNLPNSSVDEQKFLEFSLYNLSNFVAPTTTDLIEIQGPVALAWAPTSSIYYGTPLDGTILAATATDSANGNPVQGTFVYTTSTGLTLSPGVILDANTYSITATFTPLDPVGYQTPAPITNYMLTVLPDPTMASIAANPASTPAGQSVTLTASLSDAYYPVAGVVTFYDGTAVLGTSTVDPTSQTSVYTIDTFSLGSHEIKACLNASQDYLPSCSGLAPEVITLPPTVTPTISLVSSGLNPSVAGQNVTFIANVSTTGPFTNFPTGTVTFLDGATVLGTAMLTNGVGAFSTTSLAVGSHTITVSYAGTASIAASVSPAMTQIVNASLGSAGSGFLMTVTPSTFTVGAGASVTLGITIVDLNNFNTAVALSCTGLPAESTCTFGTATVPAGGGTTTLQVQVAAPHNCGANSSYFTAQGESSGIRFLALVTFVFFARRRRALKGLLLAAVLCILPAITGCSTCTDLGVKPGSYSFTVTGSANAGSAAPVTVTVPGETVSGGVVTQTQAMSMGVTI